MAEFLELDFGEENEKYWRSKLKGQPVLKKAPPRSAWERFIESVDETIRHYSPAAAGARAGVRALPLDRDYEELTYGKPIADEMQARRRAGVSQKEKERREVKAHDDPPDSVGDYILDFGGALIGGMAADPTNLIAPGGSLVKQALSAAGIGVGADAALQGAEMLEGVREEFDPVQTAINAVVGPAMVGGIHVGRKAVDKVKASRAVARGGDLDLDTAVGIGNKFGKVTSTVRSPERNKKVGGVPNSYHLSGQAIDVARGKGVSHKQIERAYKRAGFRIIESIDEGDHSHFAFAFGDKVKEAPDGLPGNESVRPMDPMDIARIMDDKGMQDALNEQKIAEDLIARADNSDLDAPLRDPTDLNQIMKDHPEIADDADMMDAFRDSFTPEEMAARRRLGIPDEGFKTEEEFNAFWGIGQNKPKAEIVNLEDRRPKPTVAQRLKDGFEKHVKAVEDNFDEARITELQSALRRSYQLEASDPEAEAVIMGFLRRLSFLKNKDTLTPAERQEMDATGKAPILDSSHEKFTPYVDTDNLRAANDPKIEMFNHPTRLNEKASAETRGVEYEEVWMTPDEYSKLAAEANSITPKEGSITKLQKRLEKEGLQNTPFLQFDTKGKVISQEGLHRAAALKNLGYDKIPVRIYGKPKRTFGQVLKNLWKDESGSYRDGPDDPRFDDLDPEQKLINAIKSARPVTAEQKRLYRQARAERAGNLDKLQQEGGGRAAYAKQMAALKGELPRADYESIAKNFSEDDVAKLLDRVNFNNSLLPYEKVSAQTALMKLLGAEGLKVPNSSDLKLLSQVFSDDFIQALLQNRTLAQKLWDGVKNALNLPRAIMSSMDLSAPFRQGIFFVGRKEFWNSFVNMFKLFGSEKASRALMDDIRNRPTWQLMKKHGLAIVDPHSHFLMDREEDFMSNWAEKIPLVGLGVKASNRAYSGFLNKLRADVFDDFVRKYEDLGVNLNLEPKKVKDMVRFINAATGRGNLGQWNQAAPALNTIFFSPRLIASRVQMLTDPRIYVTADPVVRKEAIKSLLTFGTLAMSVAGLAKFGLGMEVETDPRSPDFMKPKIGNTRYDILGGFQQYIRLASQLVSGQTVTSKGDTKELGDPEEYKADTRRDVLIRFGINKLSPVASFVSDWLEGKDPTGEPFDWQDSTLKRFIPMFAQDAAEVYEEWGAKGLLMATPGLFGVGTQTYKPREDKSSSDGIEVDFTFEDSEELTHELDFSFE